MKQNPLKVVLGTSRRDMVNELIDILKIPQGSQVRSMSWEGSSIHPQVVRECIETDLRDEDLLDQEFSKDADVIAVMNASGYRVVRDNRPDHSASAFIHFSKNMIVIHPVGADVSEHTKDAITVRTESYYPNTTKGFAVSGVVYDQENLDLRYPRSIRVVNLLKDENPAASVIVHTVNERVLATYISLGTVGLSLGALDVSVDQHELMTRDDSEYGFVMTELAHVLLWGLLEQQPTSIVDELLTFLQRSLRFVDPALFDAEFEQRWALQEEACTQFGDGAWSFMVNTLVSRNLMAYEERNYLLTGTGIHFYHLLQIAMVQNHLE